MISHESREVMEIFSFWNASVTKSSINIFLNSFYLKWIISYLWNLLIYFKYFQFKIVKVIFLAFIILRFVNKKKMSLKKFTTKE